MQVPGWSLKPAQAYKETDSGGSTLRAYYPRIATTHLACPRPSALFLASKIHSTFGAVYAVQSPGFSQSSTPLRLRTE